MMFRQLFNLAVFLAIVQNLPATARQEWLVAQEPAYQAIQLDVAWRDLTNPFDPDQRPSIVRIAEFRLDEPRLIRGTVAKIDLRGPLEFVVTPGNGAEDLETNGLRTSSFLDKYNCHLAINAGPYGPVLSLENGHHDISGLQIADGEIVSPADPSRPCLLIDVDNQVTILDQPPTSFHNIHHAVSGFHLVLADGEILGRDDPLHPRTGAGVSRDGHTLYLLAVDGRQENYSHGVSTREVGQLLKALGAHRGINFDGGGSTTMVARNRAGRPVVLNRPIHAGLPGWQRPTGSHLGIRFTAD